MNYIVFHYEKGKPKLDVAYYKKKNAMDGALEQKAKSRRKICVAEVIEVFEY